MGEVDPASGLVDPVLLVLLTLSVPCVFLLLEASNMADLFQILVSELPLYSKKQATKNLQAQSNKNTQK